MAPKTYADVIKPRSHEHDGEALAFSVNRTNSASSNLAAYQLNSQIRFSQPFHDPSLAPDLGNSASSTLGAPSASTSRPPIDARRPSIAQVLLSKVSTRSSSFFSDAPSSSSNFPEVRMPPGHVDPVLSRPVKRKRRPRNRRRKSSQTRDHGDFIISRGRIPEVRLRPATAHGPLLEAILDGNVGRVKELVVDKSNINDGHNHKPLQLAAMMGLQNIVHSLLDSGHIDINARDSRERTALFAATSRGHDSVVNFLLERNARPLSFEELRIAKLELERYRAYLSQVSPTEELAPPAPPTVEGAEITAEPEQSLEGTPLQNSNGLGLTTNDTLKDEHLQILEIGSHENIREFEEAANYWRQEAQKKGDWVRGPVSPSHLSSSNTPSPMFHKHSRYPGFDFPAPVIEFDFSENGGHRVIRPIPTVDELLYGTHGVDTLSKGKTPEYHNTCRWYHLPANNIGWAEDLIRKIYEKRSPAEQKKRDVILRREPFSDGDADGTNSSQLDPTPQSRSLRPVCRNMTLDRDGAQRLSSALALHVPYAHWETEENRAEMHYVMTEVREARKSDIDSAFQRSIPAMKTIEEHPGWSKDEKLLCAYLYNNPPIHPRRTLDQFYYDMLEDTELRDKDQVISRYYREVWKKNHHLPEDDDEREFSMAEEDEPLHRFILNTPSNDNAYNAKTSHQPAVDVIHTDPDSRQQLNVTRTISNTRGNALPGDIERKEVQHVMMVDQLWLWILDENTIISCFPRHWDYDKEHKNAEDDSHDVLRNIYRYLALANRPPLETIHDIAQLIVYNCLSPFCKKPTPYGHMQILDVYKSAIASVTDKETRIFNQFADESKEAHRNESLSKTSVHHENLYNIDQEIDQLKEVKDIQDELHILSVLLGSQIAVLKEAKKLLSPPVEGGDDKTRTGSPRIGVTNGAQVVSYSSEKDFHKLLMMVVEQEERRRELDTQANHANNALNHLLDLKQKQANVSEARSARLTSESTKQQGNIMVLFTLVTIIFAPLSLMSTMFSVRIVEFPVQLHMSYVLKYMFAVSVGVIVPLIGLLIYTTRVTLRQLFDKLKKQIATRKWVQRMRWNRRKERLREKLEGSEIGSDASTADFMDVRESKTAGGAFVWKRGGGSRSLNGTAVDSEKGLRANIVTRAM